MHKGILTALAHVSTGAWITALGVTLAVGGVATGGWYGYERYVALSARLDELEAELATTTALLQDTIADATSTLSDALAKESQNVASVKEKLGGFENQVGQITGTVTTLQKLSQTDPELLAKYSKVFFLSENYAPARLVEIPAENRYREERPAQVVPEVWPFLASMLSRAAGDGVTLYVYSAYRSFDTQEALKGQYSVTYGTGTANQFSADQGYSEHQIGTTIDFITTGLSGELTEKFDTTAAYAWLDSHAYQYGFVLSYPKGNEYYLYEPWHWRFVGVELATYLHSQGKHFYDLDQRTIDTYLAGVFD